MKKLWGSHITVVAALAVFIVLCLACASTPEGAMTTTKPQQGESAGASSTQPAAQYWTGDGGKEIRLGILVPHSQGLSENQEYLPVMVQGVLVSNISQYSAISVLDRVSLDRVITETLDLTYEDDWDIVRIGHVTQVGYMMTGDIIKTASGYSLQINVTDTTAQAKTIASYSGTCTAAELDDHSAIRRASLELLQQMNVRLTTRARNELARASAQETIDAETALAQGITAQRQGTEVAALSYYLQAVSYDPSLLEAETRLKFLSDDIVSGNVGMNIRNDIQWRSQWIARLKETEDFLARYLSESPAYYLIYSSFDDLLDIDYVKETATLSVELRSVPVPLWFEKIKQIISTVKSGLLATGRAEAWRLNWPAQSVTTPSPFSATANTYAVVVEILNAAGNSIGRQTVNLKLGGWFMPDGGEQNGAITPYIQPGVKLSFPGINANVIDGISLKISTINGKAAESALPQLGIRALPQREYDNIQSIIDNGLQLENLRQFDIRFDGTHNVLRGYQSSTHIPYGVTMIDRDSGLRNKKLTVVTLPSSLVRIGDYAFDENLLTGIRIPDGVISIGNYAFNNNNLNNVSIGSSVASIGQWAFSRNRLTSVTIPDSVSSIGDGAFYSNGYFMSSVSIGANVSLSGYPFEQGNFAKDYNDNNRKAGTYAYNSGKWNYSSRR